MQRRRFNPKTKTYFAVVILKKGDLDSNDFFL